MSEVTEKKMKELSRRKFLQGAGTSLAGVALAGGVGALLTGRGQAESNTGSEVAAAKWPFEYKKLDPDEAAKRGYDAYKEDG